MLILQLEDGPARGPFEGHGLWRRVLPFAGALGLAFLSSPLTDTSYEGAFWGAVVLTVLLAATTALAPWRALPSAAQVFPALLFLAVVVLLRHSHGGAPSGFAPLLLLPLVWLALYGNARHVVVGVLAMATAAFAPIVAFGAPLYPTGEWRRGIFMVLIGTAVAIAINSLVGRLQAAREAREQLAARQLLEQEAAKIYEDVTQRLAAAKLALELHDQDSLAYRNLSDALDSVKRITTALLGEEAIAEVSRQRATRQMADQ